MVPLNALPLASTITLAQFDHALSLHPFLTGQLTQQALDQLPKKGERSTANKALRKDALRYEVLPRTLEGRKKTGAWLDKKEVQDLMDWKLKYGKFRPQLPALVASNDAAVVHETSKAAFAIYEADKSSYAAALKELAKLKGIGPATASLLLSVYDEENVPFFSDELFRWVCWDEQAGWKRKIKYDMKEYGMLWEGVERLREKLGRKVKAVDLEKVAYVCGRLGADKKLADIVYASVSAENEERETPQTGKSMTVADFKAMERSEQGSEKEAEKEAEKESEQGRPTQPAPKRKKKAAAVPNESEIEPTAPRAKRTRRG